MRVYSKVSPVMISEAYSQESEYRIVALDVEE